MDNRQSPARGPLIVSRHGRPALDHNIGPRLSADEYRDWWQRYEIGGLADDQDVPAELLDAVSGADIVLSSSRRRAAETANRASGGKHAQPDAVFDEAPMPPPSLNGRKLAAKTWYVVARIAWLLGHTEGEENLADTRLRAKQAALTLHEAAEGKAVYVAAHGWFNRMLRRPLRKLGWVCVRDGGDDYWSYRVYEYRRKS